jgi:hypothetical protein
VKLNGTKAGGILGLHWRCAQVIHDASFDVAFLNAEFDRLKPPAIPRERLVDTLFWRGPSIRECRTGWTTLLALFDRQFPPHKARRAARCRTARSSILAGIITGLMIPRVNRRSLKVLDCVEPFFSASQ